MWAVQRIVQREQERELELRVSAIIRAMQFLWIDIDEEPGAGSLRGYIERNAIGLVSNYEKPAFDTASADWLGRFCNRDRVCASGLWNWRHVTKGYEPGFFDRLEALMERGAA